MTRVIVPAQPGWRARLVVDGEPSQSGGSTTETWEVPIVGWDLIEGPMVVSADDERAEAGIVPLKRWRPWRTKARQITVLEIAYKPNYNLEDRILFGTGTEPGTKLPLEES